MTVLSHPDFKVLGLEVPVGIEFGIGPSLGIQRVEGSDSAVLQMGRDD